MSVTLTIQHGELDLVPFDQMIDPETNRTRVRLVDINNYTYQVALA